MRAATSSCSSVTAPALQIALNRGDDFLLAHLVGGIERGEAPIGKPDVSDDLAVSTVVEVKEIAGLILKLGGSRFTQLAELAQLV